MLAITRLKFKNSEIKYNVPILKAAAIPPTKKYLIN
jgi:hypothetical protein